MPESSQQDTTRIILPENIYRQTMRLFAQDGTSFEDAIATDPRLTYEVFGLHLRDALLVGGASILAVGDGTSIDKKKDGTEAFNAVAQKALGNILPPIGDEEREVVIKVIKNPSFLSIIRKRKSEPKLKKEVRFIVPAISEI